MGYDMNLIDHRDAVLRSVQGSTCAVDYPELPIILADLFAARQTALSNLKTHNDDRSKDIEAAIHRAADKALRERNRQFVNPRNWTGLMHGYLWKRYAAYGLAQMPCKRTIRSALKTWTPPTSDAQTLCQAESIFEGKRFGELQREGDEHGTNTRTEPCHRGAEAQGADSRSARQREGTGRSAGRTARGVVPASG